MRESSACVTVSLAWCACEFTVVPTAREVTPTTAVTRRPVLVDELVLASTHSLPDHDGFNPSARDVVIRAMAGDRSSAWCALVDRVCDVVT
jgi:hypothetical protein